jgi:hypothetical protein
MNDEGDHLSSDLHQLANAAQEFVAEPFRFHRAFVIAGPMERIGAAIVDVVLGGILCFLSSACYLIGVIISNGDDIVGRAEGQWIILLLLSLSILIYTSIEAFGKRTFGKWIFGLMIVAADEKTIPSRYWRRWAFKMSPVIAYALVVFAGLIYTATIDSKIFYEFAWFPGLELWIVPAVPAFFVFVSFLRAFGSTRDALYDHVTFLHVVRRARLIRRGGGFDVLAAQPVSLEAPASSGYSPPGQHE